MAHIGMGHNDVARFEVPHLDFVSEGYVPFVGVLGGDYTALEVCLDCGRIQGWERITDKMIRETREYSSCEAGRLEAEARRERELAEDTSPPVIDMAHMERQRIVMLLTDAFGPDWLGSEEAREILINEAFTAKGPTLNAVLGLIRETAEWAASRG